MGFFIHDQLIACVGQYTYNPIQGECELIDLNGDGLLNVLDVVALVNIILS